MGLRVFLLAPAIMIMIVSIFLGGGNLQSQTPTNTAFCNLNSNSTVNPCAPNSSIKGITCKNTLLPCKIFSNCITPTPPPAWCYPFPLNLVPTAAGTYLNAGATVILNSTQFAQGFGPNGAILSFGSIGPAGFIGMIVIAVSIGAIASITVLNSGMGSAGAKLIVLGGLMVGIWTILTLMDGFLGGNTSSLFSELNLIQIQHTGMQFGTALYIMLSLMWVIAFTGLMDGGL